MDWNVRARGVGERPRTARFTGALPPGRFAGGDDVVLDGVAAEQVDFSGQRFRFLSTEGSTFVECDFSRTHVESGSFDAARTSRFVGCRFDGFRPGALLFGGSRFEDCSFEDMRLKDWRPEAAEFVGCRFSGRFDGLVLQGVPQFPCDRPERMAPWRTRNEFRGNDLSRADLRFPDFRNGVDVLANSWPSGDDYLILDRWQERLARALSEVSRWEDALARERALWWLRLERSDGREDQTATVIHKPDWHGGRPGSGRGSGAHSQLP